MVWYFCQVRFPLILLPVNLRDSWLAVQAAVDFVREHLGVEMQHSVPVCSYSARNSQCIGKRCPFSAAKQRALEAKTAPSF